MKRFIYLLISLFVVFSCLSNPIYIHANYNGDSNEIAIIFTHDLHSHLNSFYHNGENVGGFAKIKTVINSTKEQYANTLIVDAGDFSMGTLYQTVFESVGAEYSMLGELGYDAITLGNHEFDYGFDALKNMITSAKNSAVSLPPILASNIDSNSNELSESLLNSLNIFKYTIIKKGDYSIAVFGLLGNDAVSLSGSGKIQFNDYIDTAKETVATIQKLHSPDMIVCLSHSGTGSEVDDEDVELAEAVPEINLIISGHTHTLLNEPKIVGNTIIASCGEYGINIGKAIFEIKDNIVSLKSYDIIKINESINNDEDTANKLLTYKDHVNSYLKLFGYNSPDEIIAYSPFDFPEQKSMEEGLFEQQLGNLISDSYVHAIKKAEGNQYTTVDVAVVPLGVIRSSIDKGNITVSQIYEILSLGIGNDGISGYPLCSVYLYGYELWDLAEVDASVSAIMPYAQLYCSGLGYSANTNRMFLNRVYDCWLIGENGQRIEIENDKLYRVVSSMSSVQLLGTVKDKSFGLLELTPKDNNSNIIYDFNSHIATDINGVEVKEWKALADYLASFEKGNNSIPTIPERYNRLEGRKNISDDFKLAQIFTNWSFISWAVLIIIVLLLTCTVFIIIKIIKKIKKKRLKSSLSNVSEDNLL